MQTLTPGGSRSALWTGLCSFLIPCAIMAVVFAAMGVYPFGDKSLLIIDMNSEYVDYLAQMNESVRTGGSLLRSWNMGMGLNMLGLIAFYTSSPFNLLVMLLPVEWITEVLFAVTLLKLGLAGLCFSQYTGYVMERRGTFAVVFSVAYALCGYNIAYASNIMWLDGAAVLPLVLLGAEKLLRENKSRTFLLSLVYVFFTSYYIGYMIGVFSFLYFTAVWFSRCGDWRTYLRKLLRFIGSAVAAAGCCAFLLLPAFLNLKNGQSAMWDLRINWAMDKSLVRMASRLLPGVYDTLTDPGYPNIYCTVVGLLLCVCFFANKAVTRREKIVFGSLVAFLLVSFSWVALDLAWHAFEDPTWFPARYSFVFCFLVLYLAMRAANEMDGHSVVGVFGAVTLLAVVLLEIAINRYRYVSLWSVAAAGLLIALSLLLWLLWRRGHRRWLAALALLLVCTETAGNAYVMERRLDEEFTYKSRDSYTSFQEEYGAAVDLVHQQDTGVYRLEILEQRNANGGMALGYNGISHYSTTTDQNLNAFLRQLGYNKGTENELRFARSTPLTNGLLGIKYVLSRQDLGEGYLLREHVGEVGVYENTLAFPLAFWTEQVPDSTPVEDDPFQLQNNLLSGLGLEGNPFSPIALVSETPDNTDRVQEEHHIRYQPRVSAEPAAVEFYIHNPKGQQSYAYFPVWNNRFAAAEIDVNGETVGADLRYRKNTLVPMGSGEDIALTIRLPGTAARIRDAYFYNLDLEAATAMAASAREQAVQFDTFRDTAVTGAVSAPRDGLVATTFPLDSGWRVWVDGVRVEPSSWARVFLAIPVTAGEHTLSMKYSPPGYGTGCVISALTIIYLVFSKIFVKFLRLHDPNVK